MFEASYPVSGRGFYDRKSELERLVHLVRRLQSGSPKWLMVIGQRKVGKTSLLTELARRVGPALPIAIIDVQDAMPLSKEFFRTYAIRVVDRLWSIKCGVSLEATASDPESFRNALLESASYSELPPSLRRQLGRLPDAPCDTNFVHAALTIPEELASCLGLKVLVAIDEFQDLGQLRNKRRHAFDPFPVMRSVWQRHRNVSYVVSGSARSMLLDLTTDTRAPFYQHFDIMELGPFGHADARSMFRELSAPYVLADEQLSHVIDTLACHPFYLQLFGETLMELCETGETDPAPPQARAAVTVKPALQRVLFSRTGRLALYFERVFDRAVGHSATQSAVLNVLCEGPATLGEVARQIGAAPGSTSHYIERLSDVVVAQEDGRYTVSDPVFALWLRWRKPGGTVVPMRTLGDEAEREVAQLLARAGFELVYQSRGSRGAFDLLATRGPSMIGVQVKKSALPSSLARTEANRMITEAKRYGWKAALAIVDPGIRTSFFDIHALRTSKGRGALRVDAESAIDNLLLWAQSLDTSS